MDNIGSNIGNIVLSVRKWVLVDIGKCCPFCVHPCCINIECISILIFILCTDD